jgi:hypothetical protein
MACWWGRVVGGPGRPKWYAPILAVRSSGDRRLPLVVSAIEDEGVGGVRVSLEWCGAHLGLVGDDRPAWVNGGVSEMLHDVVGEVNGTVASL